MSLADCTAGEIVIVLVADCVFPPESLIVYVNVYIPAVCVNVDISTIVLSLLVIIGEIL